MPKRERQTPTPQDVDEALEIRAEISEKRKDATRRKPELIQLVKGLARRSGENHFIDLHNFYAKGN